MLTEVKNHLKIMFLSTKYAIMREMLNKTTFITNILFMILNNASFLLQWVVLYSIKENVGGYTLKQIILLWALAAGTYGFSHFFFKKAYTLSDTITNGKLDSFLVQPKNILISSITSDVEVSALGDLLYGYIMFFIYGFSIKGLILFTLFVITGGLILTSIIIILSSLSFWFTKTDTIVSVGNSLCMNFTTYPDGIFKGVTKILLFTVIPVGMTAYLPLRILTEFNIFYMIIILLVTTLLVLLAFVIFYKGLRRYSSSNLMASRI